MPMTLEIVSFLLINKFEEKHMAIKARLRSFAFREMHAIIIAQNMVAKSIGFL
jgi:hypothetical protein